jgi:hypothetical protein
MNRYPYLRAYMGGVTLPTAILLIVLTIFYMARFVCDVPVPIERAIVFPMAIIPNLYGLWNILYVALRRRRQDWSIGIHGAILPFILAPLGYGIARLLGILDVVGSELVYFHVIHIPVARVAIVFAVAVAGYYLLWKYVINFFNRVLELD